MENQRTNIENTLREKFEAFAPSPPEHIWEGIAAGIGAQAKPLISTNVWKGIGIAASILLLLGLGFWWFMPKDESSEIVEITEETITTDEKIVADESLTDANVVDETEAAEEQSETVVIVKENETAVQSEPIDEETTAHAPVLITVADKPVTTTAEQTDPVKPAYTKSQDMAPSIYTIASYDSEINNELPQVDMKQTVPPPTMITGTKTKPKISGWTQGFYFTPEVMLNDFDSVTILPAYSLNYEPTYHFNNHFFIRFGAGLQYARDRGFAKIDYTTEEVVGTYEDVYDITFDSIDGNLVATYHTKTTEVWDIVRHIYVSEITNKYLYLQVPVLLGYHKKATKLNWFFYGGPAINMMLSKWIEEPAKGIEEDNLINLDNKLPVRSSYYMQLWFGAGIEYKFSKKVALALEPNYRYYFNQVYKDDAYKRGLSSFGLRVGIVYMVK